MWHRTPPSHRSKHVLVQYISAQDVFVEHAGVDDLGRLLVQTADFQTQLWLNRIHITAPVTNGSAHCDPQHGNMQKEKLMQLQSDNGIEGQVDTYWAG